MYLYGSDSKVGYVVGAKIVPVGTRQQSIGQPEHSARPHYGSEVRKQSDMSEHVLECLLNLMIMFGGVMADWLRASNSSSGG